MRDPLVCIEAVIERLGSREARLWTLLDTSQGQVSKAEAQENCGFGHSGRFGHRTENTIGDDLVGEHESLLDRDAEASPISRASSLIPGTVQSVQSVQKHRKSQRHQNFGFGQLRAAGVQNPGWGVQNPASEGLERQHSGRVLAPERTPTEWIEGVALLRNAPAPRGYPQRAWQQLIPDAERFLERWAGQAAVLGWSAWELFGCHRRAPWGRIQGMGLVLLLQGDEIAALTATEAVIRTPTRAHQTYRRRPADPLHPAERSLVWELDTADAGPARGSNTPTTTSPAVENR
jgi:hypothetical protein